MCAFKLRIVNLPFADGGSVSVGPSGGLRSPANVEVSRSNTTYAGL